MIETLSFEIDEAIYDALKAELSVAPPFFTGKIAPKLPRLINQWIEEETHARHLQPTTSVAARKRAARVAYRVSRGGVVGAARGREPFSEGHGRSRGKPAIRVPRLVNQWIPEERKRRSFSADGPRPVRRHHRTPCKMLIEYRVSSHAYVDFVRNVSRSGAYLETRRGVSVGNDVILMIPLCRGRKLIRVKGEVIRKDGAGVGIVFKEVVER